MQLTRGGGAVVWKRRLLIHLSRWTTPVQHGTPAPPPPAAVLYGVSPSDRYAVVPDSAPVDVDMVGAPLPAGAVPDANWQRM